MKASPIRVKAHDLLETWLRTWSPNGKKVAVVYGPVGVGKSTAITYVARKLGLGLATYDQSNNPGLEYLLARARAREWGRLVVLHLDRPLDDYWLTGRELGKLVRAAVNPVVIETEDKRKYQWLAPAEIRVDPPAKAKIAEMIRRSSLVKPNFRLVGTDVRQALMLSYGADSYRDVGWLDAVERCIKTGACTELDESHLPVLLDTYTRNCYGLECLHAVQLLVAADVSRRTELLDGFRIRHAPSRPSMYFYERWKVARASSQGS